MRAVRILGVAFIVAVAFVCALFSLSAHARQEPVVDHATFADTVLHPADSDMPDDDVQGTVDLFGNDVSDAVARYQFDATGSLYEVHSPQTEIPKLGSPKS